MQTEIIINPIGFLTSDLKKRYQTPHQGVLAKNSKAVIHLNPKQNFEQAVKDLNGFERIWVIYQFHLNKNWKPLVNPPRYLNGKIGVFATRAPYRPNQIGLSCVKLEKVEGLKIFISESDILDGTPILDIKPYLPYSDSFPDLKTGWVKTDKKQIYEVSFNLKAKRFVEKLKSENDVNLFDYTRVQLEFNPTDTTRKRIKRFTKRLIDKDYFVLTYQKWKIIFSVNEKEKLVLISDIIPNDK
ncbi:MAG: tRNA (N6-threonylcarbamoyladenosine(37)-N6)-methyltransferase TrmO [Ignavibacteriaceae bacterium]|nr:tRNA (N6-threonylcarbamoyladenosine(37)-N6)-methyltransferase TrmO [Ignavibacterium sp.]MCC6253545.1 tRNA (N6-threonylcarbamoyladenosine(37)-N6)-methyltransferase TrmO [Ignavibacteriaceae bacterium]HRN27806.1 tRNA (N6-threonylcarbamoyladenosine(37)-N6)-methyltransferase TrmO [Ignavibacteriaceae bacterium]HRP94012.1 tRNA (N6-threonylcarbamoyladenosine(37)-N6)-methyltransferase TrmO [Ignavibacteriaceae bacterium]HRQ55472.1 tRNA (N6-threonylcarbamoyladenosine(37)-N6)-methyltransferase TrmO [Ign